MADEFTGPTAQAARIWRDALTILYKDVSVTSRNKGWLEGVHPEAVYGSTIVLCINNTATQQALQGELSQALQSALTTASGTEMFPAFKIVPPDTVEPQAADIAAPTVHQQSGTVAQGQPEHETAADLPESASHQGQAGISPPAASSTTPASATQVAQPTFERSFQNDLYTESFNHRLHSGDEAGIPRKPLERPAYDQPDFSRSQSEYVGRQPYPLQAAPAQPTFLHQQYDTIPASVPSPVEAQGKTGEISNMGQKHKEDASTEPINAEQDYPLVDKRKMARDPETHLNPNATFDTFVPGDSNRFARTVALAVAEGNSKDFNPLCIYGGSGLGKTHLLNAIGNYALVKDRNLKVRYVTSEEFTNEFIEALQIPNQSQTRIAAFNRRYRQVDVLLIDDIQSLGGREQTLEQFFNTFNALYQAGKRIVIASDVAPRNLKGFEDRLTSRFDGGLTVDVKPPDLETRIAILRLMASMSNSDIPDDVVNLIAERFTDNIRELEGALTRVTAMASLDNQPVSRALAEQTLQDFFTTNVEIKPTDIIGQVAKYFHLTFDDLVGRARTKNVALARQIAMYLAREMTSMSLVDIGEVFGGRDHTTVMHAYTRISGEMQEKQEIYNYVIELTVRLKQHPDE